MNDLLPTISYPLVSTKENSKVIVSFSPTYSSGFFIIFVLFGKGIISSPSVSPYSNSVGSSVIDFWFS